MEAETTEKTTRKPPGPVFFLGAMGIYLLLVHGVSLWTIDAALLPAIGPHPELPAYTRAALEGLASITGRSQAVHAALLLVLLYATMVAIFFLTHRLARGPVWLGSLAGSAFMAHPVKTEIFFETIGAYYLLACLLAVLCMLAYVLVIQRPGLWRYLLALGLYALASFPFTINAPLFGALLLLEFYPANQENRQWLRLAPFLAITTAANWFHMDTIYAQFPVPAEMVAPLLLLLYPIGLLPETVAGLHASPIHAWGWGVLALLGAAMAFACVRNGAFRVCLLGLLAFRFFPGAEPIDYTTLAGGGQLLFPAALGCVALAGFTRWLMRYEAWGRPAIALTTMLCLALFVLQFQANREYAAAHLAPADRAVARGAPDDA